MSLILEALRKSEAERRRGQAPGLFVEQRTVPARRRSGTPVWAWGLGLLLAGVLLAWGWREFGARGVMGGASTTGVSANAATAETSAPATPAAAPATPTQGAAPMNASLDALTRDSGASPPGPSPQALPPGATPREPGVLAPDGPTSPATAGATDATPGGAGPAPAASAPAAAGPVASQMPAGAAPSIDSAPDATGPPGAAPAPPPVIADAADDPPLPRLSELTGDERSQLPALKLSMHVFAEDPAQRFVILDGKRLREGDSPAAGVVLEAIRRDGLVISVNGRRLLLARP